LQAWGWRIPFLVGGRSPEQCGRALDDWRKSPDFDGCGEAGTLALNPPPTRFSRQRAALARAFAISALGLDHLLRRHHLCARRS
jgi:hypothetical protein